jgi:hypothetical protein
MRYEQINIYLYLIRQFIVYETNICHRLLSKTTLVSRVLTSLSVTRETSLDLHHSRRTSQDLDASLLIDIAKQTVSIDYDEIHVTLETQEIDRDSLGNRENNVSRR